MKGNRSHMGIFRGLRFEPDKEIGPKNFFEMACTIYTIGHALHSMEHLLALLACPGIKTLADIRSQPYSRRAPHFNKNRLEKTAPESGLNYLFLGRELGGRPSDRALYRPDGRPDYALLAASPAFAQGLDRLVLEAGQAPTAVMCAEEDPARCHRRGLLAPALAAQGFEVLHIRGDGRIQAEQTGLFIP
jgi:uncharacterized protein (DUF488 family)